MSAGNCTLEAPKLGPIVHIFYVFLEAMLQMEMGGFLVNSVKIRSEFCTTSVHHLVFFFVIALKIWRKKFCLEKIECNLLRQFTEIRLLTIETLKLNQLENILSELLSFFVIKRNSTFFISTFSWSTNYINLDLQLLF